MSDPNITKTDLQVLRELIDDPRQKIEELSKKTKLSTKTINRIRQLSVADELAESIRRINNEQSLSALFKKRIQPTLF